MIFSSSRSQSDLDQFAETTTATVEKPSTGRDSKGTKYSKMSNKPTRPSPRNPRDKQQSTFISDLESPVSSERAESRANVAPSPRGNTNNSGKGSDGNDNDDDGDDSSSNLKNDAQPQNDENEPEALPFTSLDVNMKAREKETAGNAISTTKYNWFTWLPKSLWDQFRRIANGYFLFISILMLIGTYATFLYQTPLDPFSTVGTLVVVLLITSIKELVEDRERAKSDQVENNREVTVVTFTNDGQEILTKKKSKFVNAGDIIKLEGHTPCPVDLLLIITSYYEDGNKCFIDTMNIDGETNLKVRTAPPGVGAAFPDIVQAGQAPPQLFNGNIEFEVPNKNIHKFIGTLRLGSSLEPIALNEDNLVLRSAIFTNTDWAYGIAVYAGQQTKIQMNNRHAPSKLSRIEENANIAVIIIFFAQVVLVTISVISIYALGFNRHSKTPYVYADSSFYDRDDDGGDGNSILPLWVEQWVVFFLLYNNMIPISLYVTIEMVNVGQAFLVGADEKMYHEGLDVPCTVRASNLCQELGMVSNIFSDKTGTLTRNEMKLVKYAVAGAIHDIAPSSQSSNRSAPGHSPKNSTHDLEMPSSSRSPRSNKSNSDGKCTTGADSVDVSFSPRENSDEQKNREEDWSMSSKEYMRRFGKDKQAFYEFFRCLTTCHTVIREKSGAYRAESPDELALIEGAGNYRCQLRERGSYDMMVEIFGERRAYDVLAVNKFDSDRKRMSVLLRDAAKNEYLLVCKGADNIMLPLCNISAAEETQANKDLIEFSKAGLRTLIAAQRSLSASEATAWLKKYKAAESSTIKRDKKLAAAGNEIEQNMKLLGITAIEDRLQDEVPEVIAECGRAGIIVWMLTGDKLETAISIGHSCNLLLEDTQLHEVTKVKTKEEFAERLDTEYNAITKEPRNPNAALVLDGPSFTMFAADDLEQRRKLLAIGACSRSVIACRLTPTQKRELVNLVKKDTKPQATCLSIGDGANDVSMILEANVGVGIFGKEGRQAANNADFAIGEFKFLRRLLFVHGRWNYIRQATVFLYSMHKNMVITLTLFWFSYFAAVSGTSMYQSWVYTGFNFMLGLPIIFYGFLDRDISADFAIIHPEVYATGRTNSKLDIRTIATWILNAVLYAIVICLINFYELQHSYEEDGLFVMGTIVFTGMVMALQAKVAFLHHQWAWPQITMMAISVFGMLLYYLFVDLVFIDYRGVAYTVYGMGIFWMVAMFFVPITVGMIEAVGYYTQMIFRPTPEMLYREMEHKDVFNEQCCVNKKPLVERESFGSLPDPEMSDVYKNKQGIEMKPI